MKYDAFISYRHSELDMEIAKKLHTALETYKVPIAVQKKTGKKKIQRVFRDQEELPIGSDLDDNISGALAQSEYLVVICSPRTPESVWVCKEIETFIKLHDRHHVLAILIEGEPGDSFPQQLLVDEEGNPVEPLAADVRGADAKERNAKFKTEILRLLAPILGCTFDDLRQRHRERQIKKLITSISAGAAVVALAGAAFGIYNAGVAKKMTALADEKAQLADEKTKLAEDVLLQLKGKQINQSRYLAEEANNLLKLGNREDAVLVALDALPSETNDRPFVPEAASALSNCLYAYSIGKDIELDRWLHHEYITSEITQSPKKDKLAVVDTGNITYVWEKENWNLLVKVEPQIGEDGRQVRIHKAYVDDDAVYIISENGMASYDFNGNCLYSFEAKYVTDGTVLFEAGVAAVIKANGVNIIDINTGACITEVLPKEGRTFTTDCMYVKDTNSLTISYCGNLYEDAQEAGVCVLSLSDESVDYIDIEGTLVSDMCATENGNIVVVSVNSLIMVNNSDFDIYITAIDSKTKDILWSRESETIDNFGMGSVISLGSWSYDYNGEKRDEIVIGVRSRLDSYNEFTGDHVNSVNFNTNIEDIYLSPQGTFAYAALEDGNIYVAMMPLDKIYEYYNIDTGVFIRQVLFGGGSIIVRSNYSTDLMVIAYHTADDLKTVLEKDEFVYVRGISADEKYIAYAMGDYGIFHFCDLEGNEIFVNSEESISGDYRLLEDNSLVYTSSNKLVKVSYLTQKREELDFDDYNINIISTCSSFSDDGRYFVVFGTNGKIVAVDNLTMQVVFTTDIAVDDALVSKGAVISNNGEKIVYWIAGSVMNAIDVKTGQITQLSDDNISLMKGVYSGKNMTISSDGLYFASFCSDGYVRIYNLEEDITVGELYLRAAQQSFLQFTSDGRYLIIQGDEKYVRFWNLQEGKISQSIDFNRQIEGYTEDLEDGIVFLINSNREAALVYLDTCGVLAQVNHARAFMKNNNMFVLQSDNEIFTSKYKDYKELKEIASKQFPNSELSMESRIKYAID